MLGMQLLYYVCYMYVCTLTLCKCTNVHLRGFSGVNSAPAELGEVIWERWHGIADFFSCIT